MMQPSGLEPNEWPRMIAYRRAFALAADLVEQADMELAGLGAIDPTGPESAELAAQIAAEVRREMPGDADPEVAAEAIYDAMARRRPQY
jgi:hypothetical protein